MCFMALIGAGLGVASAIQQGQASAAAAEAQAAQYRAQAENQYRQSVLENQKGGYEARRKGEQLDEATAKIRGQFAASGVTLDGSPTDVILDSRQEGALDMAAVRFGTALKVDNAQYAGQVAGMNAGLANQAADMARTSGYLNAIAPIIGLGNNQQFMTQLGMSF